MKNNLLEILDDVINTYSNKVAFYYKNKCITYKELRDDIFRMINYFKVNNIKEYDKAIILLLPSYDFYVLLLAGIYYHLDMIVIDSFKDKIRTSEMIKDSNPKVILTNNLTNMIKGFIMPKGLSYLNISKYKKESSNRYLYINDTKAIVLTTFTSGTTGKNKKIERSLDDLYKQMELINKNMKVDNSGNVLVTLPIYTLYSVINGFSIVISKKIKESIINKYEVKSVLTSIYNLLKVDKKIDNKLEIYCGGAILYPKEANMLKNTFINSNINYIYGSSEGVLIAKTTIDSYIKNGYFAFDTFIDGMNLDLINDEIVISGDVVLNNDKTHHTGDKGIIDNNILKIVGRMKYSNKDFNNYLFDSYILDENKNIKRAFSFIYKDKIYLAYEGKLSKSYNNIIALKYNKLPYDLKHKTKLDYRRVIKDIENS